MARRGLYALVECGTAAAAAAAVLDSSSSSRSAYYTQELEDLADACRDPLHSSLGCLGNLLGTKDVPPKVRNEVYGAITESLAVLIGNSSENRERVIIEPVRRRLACRIVVSLTTNKGNNVSSPFYSKIRGPEATALASSVVDCISSCCGATELSKRRLLDRAIAALGNMLCCDPNGSAVASTVADGTFGGALRTVQRELLQLSLLPETPPSTTTDEEQEERRLAVAISLGCSRLVANMRLCSKVWNYAREQKKAYQLLALVLRQSFTETECLALNSHNRDGTIPASLGCHAIQSRCKVLSSEGNIARWNEFIREAFLEAKIHSGLLEMVKSGNKDFLGWAASSSQRLVALMLSSRSLVPWGRK